MLSCVQVLLLQKIPFAPVLLETPVWLLIVSARGQHLRLAAVGEHRPDFGFPALLGFVNDVAAVGRPARKVIHARIMCKLYPLFAGDVHYINVLISWRARPVIPPPRKGQKLPIRRP